MRKLRRRIRPHGKTASASHLRTPLKRISSWLAGELVFAVSSLGVSRYFCAPWRRGYDLPPERSISFCRWRDFARQLSVVASATRNQSSERAIKSSEAGKANTLCRNLRRPCPPIFQNFDSFLHARVNPVRVQPIFCQQQFRIAVSDNAIGHTHAHHAHLVRESILFQ